MTRVIVHAGFHKTGTTSLQKYLARHHQILAPHLTYYGQNDFHNAGAHARIYAQKPFIWRRWLFRRAFAAFLAAIPEDPVIVLSRETFAGNMPGHRDWRGRPIQSFHTAAIPLCRDIIAALHRRFGPEVEIQFLFTTRASEAWISSVYGHLLRSIHLTEDLDGFKAQFHRPIDLSLEAATIAKALSPVPVHTAALEDLIARKEGPAVAILDLLNLAPNFRDQLPKAARFNSRQSQDLEDQFIALNRSGLGKARLRAQKEALLKSRGK